MRISEEETSLFLIPHLDKVVHFGIFAILAVLAERAIRRPGLVGSGKVFLLGLILAVVSESRPDDAVRRS